MPKYLLHWCGDQITVPDYVAIKAAGDCKGKTTAINEMWQTDNGSEFVSRDMDLWAYQRNVTLDFSRPGKPTDNAYIEAFNGMFRQECLNALVHGA